MNRLPTISRQRWPKTAADEPSRSRWTRATRGLAGNPRGPRSHYRGPEGASMTAQGQEHGAPDASTAGARRVLVTGASGYIGGRLVSELLASGHQVRCVARCPGDGDPPWSRSTTARCCSRRPAFDLAAYSDVSTGMPSHRSIAWYSPDSSTASPATPSTAEQAPRRLIWTSSALTPITPQEPGDRSPRTAAGGADGRRSGGSCRLEGDDTGRNRGVSWDGAVQRLPSLGEDGEGPRRGGVRAARSQGPGPSQRRSRRRTRLRGSGWPPVRRRPRSSSGG